MQIINIHLMSHILNWIDDFWKWQDSSEEIMKKFINRWSYMSINRILVEFKLQISLWSIYFEVIFGNLIISV